MMKYDLTRLASDILAGTSDEELSDRRKNS
jgi:hypothetical protein